MDKNSLNPLTGIYVKLFQWVGTVGGFCIVFVKSEFTVGREFNFLKFSQFQMFIF